MSDTWDAFPTEAPRARVPVYTSDPAASEWDTFPTEKPTDYGGIAKQAGVGVAKGAISLAGFPGDAAQLIEKGGNWLAEKLPSMPDTGIGKFLREESAKTAAKTKLGASGDLPGSYELPTSHDIQGQVEKVTGPFRKPANQVEADAETVGEFLPAAMMGPGGIVRKVVTQDAVPAAASIIAGRYSDQNPYVKALAGFIAGVGGAVMSGPGSTQRLLREKIPASVTEQDVTRAGQLIDHAQRRGVTLTWPEALSRVTGQPVLTDMQRIVESHGRTRSQMQEFFADRPQQIERAARSEFDRTGPAAAQPSMLGQQASEAAGEVLNDVRGHINRASEPFYQAAEGVLLTPAEMSHVRAIPGWSEARDAVRNNEQLNWRVRHLPDNSVGFLNEVKKYFDQAKENAASTFAQNRNQQVSSTHGMAADAIKQVAIAKTTNPANGFSAYDAALGIQAGARERYLDPLLNGPLGKIADQPETKRVINALFDANPLPGSQDEVRLAVTAIAGRRHQVAEALVRAHAEMVFNEAAQNLQGGANQFAGAKFAKEIAGNSQQRANLRAAIESLPNGRSRWHGFEHLLDVMAATGERQAKGSLTAFNTLDVQAMSSKGLMDLAAKAASPKKWMGFASDTFEAWSQGRNLDQLARIITDPRSGNALRQIVRIPPGSDRALVMAGRIIAQAGAATTEQRTKQ